MRTLDYDKLGRLQHDRVTTLGSGVDGTVRRITRSYEVRGLLQNLTSYDNATAGSGTVVNDVQYAYNGCRLSARRSCSFLRPARSASASGKRLWLFRLSAKKWPVGQRVSAIIGSCVACSK